MAWLIASRSCVTSSVSGRARQLGSLTAKGVLFTLVFVLAPALAQAAAPQKLAALTFDDGPYGQPTNQILTILKAKQVPAAFFLIGNNAHQHPALVARELAEGHIVENHSLDHAKNLSSLTPAALTKNIQSAEQIIADITGHKPALFRPPYGYTSPKMLATLRKLGYTIVMWNDAPRDYQQTATPDQIVSQVMGELKPTAIIDLHDGRDVKINYPRQNIIAALPKIIDGLRARGYTLVRLDKLLKLKPYLS